MRRGGAQGPLTSALRMGAVVARILAFAAVIVMAASGGVSMGAHASGSEGGFVTVICADGVAKTVVLDSEGNPMSPPGKEDCTGVCLCISTSGAALPTEAQAPRFWDGDATVALSSTATAVLAFERGRYPAPRGPPSEDIA